MEAKDLRVGSLFHGKGFDALYGIVDQIRSDGCLYLTPTGTERFICYQDMEPIPLTEEWLLKFGFEKEDGVFSKGIFEVVQLRRGIDLRERFEFVSHNFNPDLDYVHQLQNLYFALTGKELISIWQGSF